MPVFFVEGRYDRFLFFREHKTARECPQCGELSVGDPAATWEMRCGGCGCVFCYEHGGAHRGRTCTEYVESTADGACGVNAHDWVPCVVRAFVRWFWLIPLPALLVRLFAYGAVFKARLD